MTRGTMGSENKCMGSQAFRSPGMPAKSLQLCPTLCNFMNCSHQAPLSMGFSRKEYWNGLPFSSPGDLPDPGIEHKSLASPALSGFTRIVFSGFFVTAPPGKPQGPRDLV